MPISEVYNMDCVDYMEGIPDNFLIWLLLIPPMELVLLK